jgi:hypothetical protein
LVPILDWNFVDDLKTAIGVVRLQNAVHRILGYH